MYKAFEWNYTNQHSAMLMALPVKALNRLLRQRRARRDAMAVEYAYLKVGLNNREIKLYNIRRVILNHQCWALEEVISRKRSIAAKERAYLESLLPESNHA